jgi:membrane protease YdiL (CAAX protease family)
MTTLKAFIKRHAGLTYFALTFLISWGGMLLVGSRGILAGTNWQTDPLFSLAVLAMLAGPPVAGILLTLIVFGKAGLSELLSRLLRWRVGGHWYVVAILLAPLLELTVLLALARIAPVFLPSIVTADNKASLLLAGIAVGLVGGFVEELGWTGFAIPQIRVWHGVFATGLIVGVLWGAWHLIQMWWVGGTSAETLPLALFLPLYFFFAIAQLTAYRVLMVWVYDHTESLLVAVLMHASYIFSTLFVLAPPTTGLPFLIYSGVFTLALWVVVIVVGLVSRGHLARQRLDPAMHAASG